MEQLYWIWLNHMKDVSIQQKHKLLNILHEPEAIYRVTKKEISNIVKQYFVRSQKIEQAWINAQKELEKTKRIQEQLFNHEIMFTYIQDGMYPEKLRMIPNSPIGLYWKGNIPKGTHPTVAIVGSRVCSDYGRVMAKKLSAQLARYNIQIISGLARGIDSYAHKGCLEKDGVTFGVLASGVDNCYPRENKLLYEQIQQKGGIISENDPGTEPQSYLFPLRNRIISGLADIVIVVEAKEKSGSLITVEYALLQGKDVYAVPGRINDPLSKGCNRLIREGAGIVTCVEDILDILQIQTEFISNNKKKNNYRLDQKLEVVYSGLSLCPKNIQTLSEDLHMDSVDLAQKIVQLQLMDMIEEKTTGYYIVKQ